MSKTWTPERRKKFMATVRAKQAGKGKLTSKAAPGLAEQIADAKVYLRHAVADINKRMRNGELKRPDRAHLMAMLALEEMGG